MFSEALRKAKLRLLQMHYESKVGHIGGNLSALDVLLYLHLRVMGPDDAFVLSKGHSAGALYVALWAAGRLSESELRQFHKDASKLAGHPAANWHPGIRFATGSLGHGLGLGAGVALGKQIRQEPGTVYCVLSDGECEEGSTWEAILFCAHHRLRNLVVLIDANGLQGFGSTKDIASLEPLADKIKAFGLCVTEIPGHDSALLEEVLRREIDGPRFVVLRTIKGNGVSFMENAMEWHYLPLTEEQYKQAVEEVSAS
jgi:transketolase